MSDAVIGRIGTVLATVAAGLSDFHAVAVSPDVRVALTAVVGWLISHHIIAGAFGRRVEADTAGLTKRTAGLLTAVERAVAEATKPTVVP